MTFRMGRKSIAMVLCFFNLGFSVAKAADHKALGQLFERVFFGSFYNEGRSGVNSVNFIRHAMNEGIDLSGASIMSIENRGGDTYGMVAALQGREQGPYLDPSSPHSKRLPGEVNWSFHAVVVADGYVYDFDFGNKPQVIALDRYTHEMFIPSNRNGDANFFNRKLGGYIVDVYSVQSIAPHRALTAPDSEFLARPTTHSFLEMVGKTRRGGRGMDLSKAALGGHSACQRQLNPG